MGDYACGTLQSSKTGDVMRIAIRVLLAASSLFALTAMGSGNAQAQTACTTKIGAVISLTGPQAPVGKVIAETAQLAAEHINAGGGVRGCTLQIVVRDDSSQPAVALDAARYLVDVERVPALIGFLQSGASVAVVNALAVPAKIPVVSCCSITPALTQMAQEGKTGGFFFRTIPTARTFAGAFAEAIRAKGYKKTAMIYYNTEAGVPMSAQIKKMVESVGGSITAMVPFNENQPTYRPEISRAMASNPDSVLIIGATNDGVAILRDWIQQGGTPNVVLHNTMRSNELLAGIGSRALRSAVGIDNAQVSGPSVDAFNKAFQDKFGRPPVGPGIHTGYDAAMATALAMALAPTLDGTAIRDSIRKVHTEGGVEVYPGAEGAKAALQAIRDGKPIRYVGATGPFSFDQNGDVAGPALIWRFEDGKVVNERIITVPEMAELFRKGGL